MKPTSLCSQSMASKVTLQDVVDLKQWPVFDLSVLAYFWAVLSPTLACRSVRAGAACSCLANCGLKAMVPTLPRKRSDYGKICLARLIKTNNISLKVSFWQTWSHATTWSHTLPKISKNLWIYASDLGFGRKRCNYIWLAFKLHSTILWIMDAKYEDLMWIVLFFLKQNVCAKGCTCFGPHGFRAANHWNWRIARWMATVCSVW